MPTEDEDQVIQDAADAAGALMFVEYVFSLHTLSLFFASDQLRQRLVRMSVRHHEQLFSYQQREYQLTHSLRECSTALEDAVNFLVSLQQQQQQGDPGSVGVAAALVVVPADLMEASKKFVQLTSSLIINPEDISGFSNALNTQH
jgi:hypothetical protein